MNAQLFQPTTQPPKIKKRTSKKKRGGLVADAGSKKQAPLKKKKVQPVHSDALLAQTLALVERQRLEIEALKARLAVQLPSSSSSSPPPPSGALIKPEPVTKPSTHYQKSTRA